MLRWSGEGQLGCGGAMVGGVAVGASRRLAFGREPACGGGARAGGWRTGGVRAAAGVGKRPGEGRVARVRR